MCYRNCVYSLSILSSIACPYMEVRPCLNTHPTSLCYVVYTKSMCFSALMQPLYKCTCTGAVELTMYSRICTYGCSACPYLHVYKRYDKPCVLPNSILTSVYSVLGNPIHQKRSPNNSQTSWTFVLGIVTNLVLPPLMHMFSPCFPLLPPLSHSYTHTYAIVLSDGYIVPLVIFGDIFWSCCFCSRQLMHMTIVSLTSIESLQARGKYTVVCDVMGYREYSKCI